MIIRPIHPLNKLNNPNYYSTNPNTNPMLCDINLVDHKAIKNNSYSKLIKAYYNQLNKPNKNNTSTEKPSPPSITNIAKQKLSDIQKEANELQSTANQLLQTGEKALFKDEYTEDDKETLCTTINNLVNKFNTTFEKGSQSNITSIESMSKRLILSAKDNKSTLESIGITIEEKGLTLNKEKLLTSDLKTAKSLFNEVNSFGYFISQRAKSIVKATNNELNKLSTYTKTGTYTNTNSNSIGTIYSELA